MLARLLQIDHLHRAGNMLFGPIPDPFGPVTHRDFLSCAAPALIPSFPVEALAKRFGRFNGAGVGGGIRIADFMC